MATVMINPVAVVTVKKDFVEESAAVIVKSVRRVVPTATVMINHVAAATVKKDFVAVSAAAKSAGIQRKGDLRTSPTVNREEINPMVEDAIVAPRPKTGMNILNVNMQAGSVRKNHPGHVKPQQVLT
jgi:hypothetical protein